jgi:gamma-glutamylaminecyclotransferase
MSAATNNSPSFPTHVFAYGTLMKGQPDHGLLEQGQIKSIVRASISGELIDLGDYPGLRLSSYSKGRVSGELIEVEALDRVIGAVDNEEGPAFRREIVNVTLEDGRSHFAWTYVLASDAGHYPVIESSEWRGK